MPDSDAAAINAGLAGLAAYLERRFGLDAASLGESAVVSAVRGRMAALNLDRPLPYLLRLESDPAEEDRLLDAIIVSETWFYRDREPFALLTEIARKTLADPARNLFRVLSAACSTGEEPYSAAAGLLAAGIPPERFEVRAADVCSRALTTARRGRYAASSFREPTFEHLREIYFRREGDFWTATPALTRQVEFVRANIAAPDFGTDETRYDVIFCRNVLIYMTESGRMRLLAGLERLLAPDGLIFCGHSEAAFFTRRGFAPFGPPQAFACKRRIGAEARVGGTSATHSAPGTPPGPAAKPPPRPTAAPVAKPAARPRPVQSGRTGLNAGSDSGPLTGPASGPSGPTGPTEPPVPDTKALLRQAVELADQGDTVKALDCCLRYMESNPPEAGAYYLAGLLHQAENRTDEAERCYRKAVFLEPGHYESLVHLSLLCEAAGRRDQAAAYLERAERVRRRSGQENGI